MSDDKKGDIFGFLTLVSMFVGLGGAYYENTTVGIIGLVLSVIFGLICFLYTPEGSGY